jgi:hypothetical protein
MLLGLTSARCALGNHLGDELWYKATYCCKVVLRRFVPHERPQKGTVDQWLRALGLLP